MMEFASVIAGAVLLLLLTAALKGWLAARQLGPWPAASEEDTTEPCPEEFFTRVFTRADWEFVRRLKPGGVERLFERVRQKVSLSSVRQTAALSRKVLSAP